MSSSAPFAKTVFPWLRDNLGRSAMAALTSTDQRALEAAIQIVALWQFADEGPARDLPNAFGACVRCMQRSTQEFAFHAIAHVAEWNTRQQLWNLAGLPSIQIRMKCAFEPGGSRVTPK
jgi:hypothetical protein